MKVSTKWRMCASIACIGFMLVAWAGSAAAQSEQERLVSAAQATFANFMADKQMEWLHQNVGRAKAVLIAPSVVKAGFILGGSGGRAVLIARDPKSGRWHGPAFYTLATASVGFQAGVEVSEVVTLVMSDKALKGLLSTSVKIGGDVSGAAGPVGVGNKAAVTADMISYSHAKGLYGGLNLDGTVVQPSDWNEAFYKPGVKPADILVRGSATNKQGEKLRNAVSAAARKR